MTNEQSAEISKLREAGMSYQLAYRATHKGERAAYNAIYRAEHKDGIKAYRTAHKDRMIAYQATYYIAHKDERAVHGALYYKEHKEEMDARSSIYNIAWRKNNSDKVNASSAARRVLIAGATVGNQIRTTIGNEICMRDI